MDTLFIGMEEFPAIEELQTVLRRELQDKNLELTKAVYQRGKEAFLRWQNIHNP